MDKLEDYEYLDEEYLVYDEELELECTENQHTFEDCLILEVHTHPILYDLTDTNYNNQRKKDSVWLKISENCSRPVNECKKRWKSLRDRFRSLYNKENTTVSGQATNKKVDWQYYDALKFLIPTIFQAPSFSNYSESNCSSNHDTPSTSRNCSESSSSSKQNTPSTTRNPNKRKEDEFEYHLLQYMQTPDVEEQIDSDTSFALSLVEPLKKLSKRKNALALIKIQQVLYELEYEDDAAII